MLFAALSAAASGFQPRLQAQERRVGAELWGRVLQAGDTMGLPGARVELLDLAVSSTTTRTGLYRLGGLTPGPHLLRVQLLGYRPVTLHVELQEGRTDQRDVRLERLPTVLTEVRIEGQLRKVPPRFDDVYRRMATANGKFFTREDIQSLNPQDVQSLLERVATVRVNAGGIQFARCNEGGANILGGMKVQIYIDGLRMTGRRVQSPPGEKNPEAEEQRRVLRMVNPSQIQAIEIYSGVARIPGEFLEDACAVIAIWTRSY
jgi:hypothetical protein